jgi:hypothetical protein
MPHVASSHCCRCICKYTFEMLLELVCRGINVPVHDCWSPMSVNGTESSGPQSSHITLHMLSLGAGTRTSTTPSRFYWSSCSPRSSSASAASPRAPPSRPSTSTASTAASDAASSRSVQQRDASLMARDRQCGGQPAAGRMRTGYGHPNPDPDPHPSICRPRWVGSCRVAHILTSAAAPGRR